MSVFSQIAPVKTSDEVVHQIEGLVLEGVLHAGDRLPGERELALSTGVSRPIVREAIKTLENKGILESRHGGGTFVGDVIGSMFSPQMASVLPKHKKATHDYLEFRREIEGASAALAAKRATTHERKLLTELVDRMLKAHQDKDFEQESVLDVEFHSLIGEMSHNLILLHTMRSCNRLLTVGVFDLRERLYDQPDAGDILLDQHRSIYSAIMDGNPELARAESEKHIDYILRQTEMMEKSDEREKIAKLRTQSRLRLVK